MLIKLTAQDTLQCIYDKASALTRRSAGIPAMAIGILTACPQGDSFDHAVEQLLDIAEMPVQPRSDGGRLELPQVHALNCLKDVFSSSRLSGKTESHLERSLGLATDCIVHDVSVCPFNLLAVRPNMLQLGDQELWPDAVQSVTNKTLWRNQPWW